MQKKLKLSNKWFWVGVLAAVISAPNATIVKYVTNSIDPFVFSAIRFALIAVVTTPYIFLARRKFNAKNFQYAIMVGVFMSIAIFTYVWAIRLSQASYVTIITLITPIIFVLLSVKLTGDKINKRSIAGITLAALGAFIIIALPIAIQQKAPAQFYPLASFLALLNTVSFPLAIIYSKKSNESGLPLTSIFSISSWIVLTFSVLLIVLFVPVKSITLSPGIIFAIAYSGIVVALVARIIGVMSYEHIGSAVTSAIAYAETLLAVTLPVIILGEKISIYMVLGGVCILLGVYLAEHHHNNKHKRHYLFLRSH